MKTKDIFQNWNTFLSEGRHESRVVKNGLLREITEDEAKAIQGVLDKMDGDVLAFNDLFGGKNRLIIPLSTPDEKTDVGKFMRFFSRMKDSSGLEIDYETGIVALTMPPTSEELWAALQNPRAHKTKIKKVKVGKFFTSLIKLAREKDKIFDELGDEGKYELHPVSDKSRKILGSDFSSEARIREVLGDETSSYAELIKLFIKELGQLAKTWQSKADILKKGGDRTTDVFTIIVTRHPVDVLRMSDFDEIQSCHSPPSRDAIEAAGGEYYKCAIAEAHGHGALAYAVRIEDIEEAFNMSLDQLEESDLFQEEEIFLDDERDIDGVVPINRLRLRQIRYYNTDKEAMDAQVSDAGNPTIGGVEVAVPEIRIYGMPRIPQFRENVVAWAKQSQQEVIAKIPKAGSSILSSRIVKFGGSYEDNTIKQLITDLTGLVVMSHPRQNAKTEDNLDYLPIDRRRDEFVEALVESPNFEYFEVRDLNYEDGAIYPAIYLTFSWDTEDWDDLPNNQDLMRAGLVDDLSGYGEKFDILRDDWVSAENHEGKIYIIFKVDTKKLFDAYDSEGAYYDPYDFSNLLRKMEREEGYGSSILAIKSVVTLALKREGFLAGAAFFNLATETENGSYDALEWDLSVEGEYPEFYEVNATTTIYDVPTNNTAPNIIKKVIESRDFKIELRKEILRAPKDYVDEEAAKYFLDSLIVPKGIDDDENTFDVKVSFSIDESDNEARVYLFRGLIEEADDEDYLRQAAANAFIKTVEMASGKNNISEKRLFNNWRAFLKG